MTTSQQPWTQKFVMEAANVPLPENHTVLSDAAGNPMAWFKDHRDAELVLAELGGESKESLNRQIEDLKSEVECLEEESAKDEQKIVELEKKVAALEGQSTDVPKAKGQESLT